MEKTCSIPDLNILMGVPLMYDLDKNVNVLNHRYLDDLGMARREKMEESK
jgi:hypothetical protein